MSGSKARVVAKRITEDEIPEDGRVQRVRKELICEEDRGLAMKLQQEECKLHCGIFSEI